MFFYWRILEELRFVGETWIITDPSLLRSYRDWLRRNAPALEDLEPQVRSRPLCFPSPSVN
jgi:hypothetical protein